MTVIHSGYRYLLCSNEISTNGLFGIQKHLSNKDLYLCTYETYIIIGFIFVHHEFILSVTNFQTTTIYHSKLLKWLIIHICYTLSFVKKCIIWNTSSWYDGWNWKPDRH